MQTVSAVTLWDNDCKAGNHDLCDHQILTDKTDRLLLTSYVSVVLLMLIKQKSVFFAEQLPTPTCSRGLTADHLKQNNADYLRHPERWSSHSTQTDSNTSLSDSWPLGKCLPNKETWERRK